MINCLVLLSVSPLIQRKGSIIQLWSSQMIPVRFVDPHRASPECSHSTDFFCVCVEPDPSPLPKLCHMKCLEGQNFGFYLQVDQSSRALEVRAVETWSPAELSGLRDGDRLLEVNEEFVDKMDIHRVGVQYSANLTFTILFIFWTPMTSHPCTW